MKITLVFLVSFLLGICYSDNFDHRKWCSLLSHAEILADAAKFPKNDCVKLYCNNGTEPYPRIMTCRSGGRPECAEREQYPDRDYFPYCCPKDDIPNCNEEQRKKILAEAAAREKQQ